jgi:O-antigen/teichoic acid export membrane protein
MILGTTAMVAAWCAAPVVARLYGQGEAYGIFWSFSILFVVKALQIIPEVRLRRELNLKAIAIQGVVIQVSRGLLQLILALYGFGFWSLVIGQVFADVSTMIGIIWVAGMPRRFGWDTKLYREAFRFGSSATGSTIFSVISSTADNVIVGILFGMETLGFYGMAFYLTEQPASKLNMMISPVLSPLYSKLKDDFTAINRTYLKIARVTVLFLAPVLLGMAVTAPEAVVLVMGEKWQPMVHVFQVLSVVALLRVLSANASTVLFARNEPDRVLLVNGLIVAVHPPLFYLLGKNFGMNGILFVWLAVFPIVGVGAWLWMIRRSTGLPILSFLKEISPGIASAVLMVGACEAATLIMPAAASPAALLAVQIAVGMVSYGLLLRYIWPQCFAEIVGFARHRD